MSADQISCWPQRALRVARGQSWTDDAALLLIWIAACWPVLSGARFIPGDSLGEFFPQVSFVVGAIRHGEAPWWNPYEYGGLPVLADPQSLVFTPHTLVGLITGALFNLHLFDLTTLACPLLGVWAMRRYTAAYADTRWMPLLGSVVFMLGGVATSRLQHVPQIVSYSLIPLQLIAFRAVCLRPNARPTLLLFSTLLAGLLNLNQVTFLSAFALLPLVAWHLARSRLAVRATCCLAAAGFAALLAASPLLLALAEFLPFSNRAALPLGMSKGFSFPLLNLTSLFLPGLFGVMTPRSGFWPPTDATQDYLFIGLIGSAILGLAMWRMPRAPMPAPLFALMAVLWFAFAMGLNTPLYGFLFLHVPGFSAFRRPADGAFLMNFSIALAIGSFRTGWLSGPFVRPGIIQSVIGLAVTVIIVAAAEGLGSYALASGHAKDLWLVMHRAELRCLVIAAAVLLLVLGKARAVLPLFLVVGAVVEMLTAGRFGPVLSVAYADNTVATRYGNPKKHRAFAAELGQTIAFLHAHGSDPIHPIRFELLGGPLAGAMPLAERIAVTQGYNPMLPGAYARMIGDQDLSREAKQFSPVAPFYDDPLYRMLSVRYVLMDRYAAGDIAGANAAIAARLATGKTAKFLGAVGSYDVWELADVLPKATLHIAGLIPAGGDVGSCNIDSYGTTKLVVECTTPTAATAVVGDNYAPGWTACVNGVAASVTPYAGLFRSVPIRAGTSTIIMRYEAVPFLRGTACRPVRSGR